MKNPQEQSIKQARLELIDKATRDLLLELRIGSARPSKYIPYPAVQREWEMQRLRGIRKLNKLRDETNEKK